MSVIEQVPPWADPTKPVLACDGQGLNQLMDGGRVPGHADVDPDIDGERVERGEYPGADGEPAASRV